MADTRLKAKNKQKRIIKISTAPISEQWYEICEMIATANTLIGVESVKRIKALSLIENAEPQREPNEVVYNLAESEDLIQEEPIYKTICVDMSTLTSAEKGLLHIYTTASSIGDTLTQIIEFKFFYNSDSGEWKEPLITNPEEEFSIDDLTNEDIPEWIFENIAVLKNTIQLITEIIEESQPKPNLPRRTRPDGAAKLLPIDKKFNLWTQSHLTGMVSDVTTSSAEAWQHIPKINGFLLETNHGKAVLENVGPLENLRKILDLLGPEGLQCNLATLAHIEDVTRRKYGNLPEAYTELNPIKIVITDLLRTMGRTPDGNTFSRDQQLKTRNFLKAQSMVEYADVQPTKNGKAKLRIGPLVNILDTEYEALLPYENMPDSGEVVSVTVLPGAAVYELMRNGVRWCHPQLLKYNSKLKYEIAIGFYVQQMAVNRRNKKDQEYLAIGSIERGSGVESYGKSNIRRRLDRIIQALNQLAMDGIIPGEIDLATKKTRAIYIQDKSTSQLDSVESKRAMKVKILNSSALPNGYTPLPCTAKQP